MYIIYALKKMYELTCAITSKGYNRLFVSIIFFFAQVQFATISLFLRLFAAQTLHSIYKKKY